LPRDSETVHGPGVRENLGREKLRVPGVSKIKSWDPKTRKYSRDSESRGEIKSKGKYP